MPETIYETKYACDKCKHKYNDYSAATLCEQLPSLEDVEKLTVFNEGDELTYNNEYQIGSRWSYSSADGKIVSKILIPHFDMHQYLYWTDQGHGVLWIKNEFGWKLFSPNELKKY